MKYLLITILLFVRLLASSQRGQIRAIDLEKISFSESSFYMVCRGTLSKAALIGRQFNISDSNVTHVGIGLASGNKLLVYNVSDNYSFYNNSSFRIDSLNSFIDAPDTYCLSIWKCNSTSEEVNALKIICSSYIKRQILFDAFFNISNDDTLYCAEFCAGVLNEVNPAFNFKPISVILDNELYKAYLKRTVLIYFPVDFFQVNANFKKIYQSVFLNVSN
jgi:hypothetical protein